LSYRTNNHIYLSSRLLCYFEVLLDKFRIDFLVWSLFLRSLEKTQKSHFYSTIKDRQR